MRRLPDIGQTIAQFASVEVKSVNDTMKPDQKKWAAGVNRSHGLAAIAKEQKDGSVIITNA